jgi:hypothetical protein
MVFERGDSHMTQRKQSKTPKRRSKHKAALSANKRKPTKQKKLSSSFDSDWDDFKVSVRDAITKIVNLPQGTKLVPFERANSVLKRMVYEFVNEHRKTKRDKHIESSIANDPNEWRGLWVKFEDNPFHWVLFGLKDHVVIFDKFEISKSDITRFGRQLSYADRHHIAPQHLIGFLFQTGTISEICQKEASRPMIFEQWFKEIQED